MVYTVCPHTGNLSVKLPRRGPLQSTKPDKKNNKKHTHRGRSKTNTNTPKKHGISHHRASDIQGTQPHKELIKKPLIILPEESNIGRNRVMSHHI